MKVKEFAETFGLKVIEIAEICGYSRQGIYDVVENRTGINKNRFKGLISTLKNHSEIICDIEINRAKADNKKGLK